MILLKNFRIRNGNVETDIYPEESSVAGLLVVNSKGEIIEHLLPRGYEYCENHIAHAKRFIDNNYEKIINGEITKKLLCGTEGDFKLFHTIPRFDGAAFRV